MAKAGGREKVAKAELEARDKPSENASYKLRVARADADYSVAKEACDDKAGNVKEQWGKLTDDQLDVIAGKRDHLAGKIQETYGITKDETEKQLAEWQDRMKDKTQ